MHLTLFLIFVVIAMAITIAAFKKDNDKLFEEKCHYQKEYIWYKQIVEDHNNSCIDIYYISNSGDVINVVDNKIFFNRMSADHYKKLSNIDGIVYRTRIYDRNILGKE